MRYINVVSHQIIALICFTSVGISLSLSFRATLHASRLIRNKYLRKPPLQDMLAFVRKLHKWIKIINYGF